MSTIFVTPDDYCHTGHIFGNKAICTPLPGFDMMVVSKMGRIPIERKAVPGDLLSSVQDGRLYREIAAMRDMSPYYVLLLHGEMFYGRDEEVVTPWRHGEKFRWDKKAIRNLKRSLELVEGVIIEEACTDAEMVRVIDEIQTYFDGDHGSIRNRPALQSDWLIPTDEEKVVYFYSGLPDVKAIRARAMMRRFPRPGDLMEASVKEISEAEGIGKKTATKVHEFLHRSVAKEEQP